MSEVERRWIHVPVDTTTSLLFLLHERCRHVYNDTAKGPTGGNATVLGELMNKSDESLATMYDVHMVRLEAD